MISVPRFVDLKGEEMDFGPTRAPETKTLKEEVEGLLVVKK
jgi:hypothetical protein